MKKLLVLIFMFSSIISAQELDATVVINYEQLKTASKERLVNFKRSMEDYLNNNKFTRQEWDGDPIKCSFNIFFSSASETTYRAQVVVTSQRPIYQTSKSSLMMRVQDGSWSFKYENGQAMYFNLMDFDPLTSFLDFYAYVIIGLDMDSFYELGGTDYFSKALDVAILGSSSNFKDGWVSSSAAYNRRGLVDDLLHANFQQFRQDIFEYHYNGLDLMTESRARTQESIFRLVKNLYGMKDKINSRSVFKRMFFEAKNREICDFLNDISNEEIFEMLKKVDPEHTGKYLEVYNKR